MARIGQRDGLWWPVEDRHAYKMVLATTRDLDRAISLTKWRGVCVQAGGNCGVWAAYLATFFGEVWAIEPDLDNYRCLVRNVNGNVRPLWAALGDEPSTAHLNVDPTNIGAHYVVGGGRIPVITIDELELEACDLIVLDIEGMEPLALAGARKTIEIFRPVIMVEDKGLSKRYGTEQDWSLKWPGYKVAHRVRRDVILVPA